MNKILIILLLSIFTTQNSYSCLNAVGITIFGDTINYDRPFKFYKELRKPLSKSEIKSKIIELTIKTLEKNNPRDWINLSVYLIYDNQIDSAINVLHMMEPNAGYRYSTYANLGVAHELKGNLDSAYYWTNKGIEENPESHNESEWIHLKILEAQKGLNNNSNWLKKNTVLEYEISIDSLPIKPFKNKHKVQDLANQIEFQLREKMYFIKPENKIVGQLLFQLADLYSVSVYIVNAIGTYLLAKQYDPNLKSIIDKRLGKIKQILNPDEIQFMDSITTEAEVDSVEKINVTKKKEYPVFIEKKPSYFVWYIFGGLVLMIMIGVCVKLKNQQKK
jgi:hypothetical protein